MRVCKHNYDVKIFACARVNNTILHGFLAFTKSFARTRHAGKKTLLTGYNHVITIFGNALTLKIYKFTFFTYFSDG